MGIVIFHEEARWEHMGPIQDFKKVYGNLDGLCRYVILTEDSDPRSPVLVFVRVFLQKETRAKKYVMGTRFYHFGDIATLDIISLDHPLHKDIIAQHTESFGWPSPAENFDNSCNTPFAFVGGFVDPDLTFVGSSGDYGDNFFGWSSNDVARSAMAMINGEGESNKPDQFFSFMLSFMNKHKRHRNFYEKFYEELLAHLSAGKRLHPQHLGSLVTMKACDRSAVERISFLQTWVEEASGGLGRLMLLHNVAKHIKEVEKNINEVAQHIERAT